MLGLPSPTAGQSGSPVLESKTPYPSPWETPTPPWLIYGGECPYQVWTSYNGNFKSFIYNFIKNDKDDVIADVIPIAMGNALGF